MASLSDELAELERTDPVVAAARRKLDELPDANARYERHMAARKAVGKRGPVRETRGTFREGVPWVEHLSFEGHRGVER